MIFILNTTSRIYVDHYDINKLEELGFSFVEDEEVPGFYIIKGEPSIEIKTLAELMQFMHKYGDLVLTANCHIEIYDNYR